MEFNHKTFAEIAEDFRDAGVAVNDAAVIQAQRTWDSMPDEVKADGIYDEPSDCIFYGMYGAAGDESGNFRVLSDNLFAFEWEVEDPYCMFEDFLNCVGKINNGEFALTDIEQELPDFDAVEELETYQQKVTFCLNGKPYEYQATMHYDWFDSQIIGYFNSVLAREGISKRLYCYSMDLCSVFYGSEEWAKQFADKTGVRLDVK